MVAIDSTTVIHMFMLPADSECLSTAAFELCQALVFVVVRPYRNLQQGTPYCVRKESSVVSDEEELQGGRCLPQWLW